MLGAIDEVEVEAELEQAGRRRKSPAACVEAQPLAPDCRIGRHHQPGEEEAIGHRPARGYHRKLIADHQPGRSPDQRD
nr:hypothetical protein [Tanacetum cinerariifolium]